MRPRGRWVRRRCRHCGGCIQPLLLPAMGAAGLLVFVDAMKELPATLLLRPFNFDTLATHVYGLTALEQFERGALGALAIVVVGLVPVLMLHRTVATSRPGSGERLRTILFTKSGAGRCRCGTGRRRSA